MKKWVVIVIVLILLSACGDPNQGDDLDDGMVSNFDYPSGQVLYEYIEIRHQLSDDVVEVLDSANISTIKMVNGSLIVVYYHENSVMKTLLKFDDDFNIEWRLDGYRQFFTIEGNNDGPLLQSENRYYIEYCDEDLLCRYGIFNEQGDELITTDNLERVFVDHINPPTSLPIEVAQDVYYVVECPERHLTQNSERYVLSKYTVDGKEELHTFHSEFSINSYMLEDDSFLFTYRIEGIRRYRIEHISSDGEVLFQEESEDSYGVTIVKNGYITYQNGILERRDLDDDSVWQVSDIEERLHFDREMNDIVYFNTQTTQYIIKIDGTVIPVEVLEVPLVSLGGCLMVHMTDDANMCLNVATNDENIITRVYLMDRKSGETYWEYEVTGYRELFVKNGYVYIVSNDPVQKVTILDEYGEVVNEFTFTGRLERITDDNTMILSKGNTLTLILDITIVENPTEEEKEQECEECLQSIVSRGLEEVSIDGTVLWSVTIPRQVKSVEYDKGHYFVVTGTFDSFNTMPTIPPPPTWNMVLSEQGQILFDSSIEYENSTILAQLEDSFFVRVGHNIEDGFTVGYDMSTVIELNYDGELLETYYYLGVSLGDYYLLSDTELIVLDRRELLQLQVY